MMKPLKHIRYIVEAALLLLLLILFRVLGLNRASAVGSYLARHFGPLLHLHRRARSNLRLLKMTANEQEEQKILRGMWDNLGRVLAEYVYLSRLQLYDDLPAVAGFPYRGRVLVKGRQRLEQLLSSHKGVIFFAAHLANWELSALCVTSLGYPLTVGYRPPNNPWVRWMIGFLRRPVSKHFASKLDGGGRDFMRAIRRHEALGIVADQNTGSLQLPFLGQSARTLEMPARLALQFNVPLVPVHVVRTHGSHFTLTVEKPLAYTKGKTSISELTHKMNDRISAWIKQNPEQWLWIHNRWKHGAYGSFVP